jgi:hypothetical protein
MTAGQQEGRAAAQRGRREGRTAEQRNSKAAGTARRQGGGTAGRQDGRTTGRRDDGTTGRRSVPGRAEAVRDAEDLTRIARTEDRLQRNRPRRQSKFRARRLSQRWPQRRPAKGSAIGLEPDLHQAGHRHKDAYRDGRSARQRRMVGRQGHRTGQAVRQTAIPARRSDLASPPPADQPLDQPPTRARSPPQIQCDSGPDPVAAARPDLCAYSPTRKPQTYQWRLHLAPPGRLDQTPTSPVNDDSHCLYLVISGQLPLVGGGANQPVTVGVLVRTDPLATNRTRTAGPRDRNCARHVMRWRIRKPAHGGDREEQPPAGMTAQSQRRALNNKRSTNNPNG